jgi:serine protease Do
MVFITVLIVLIGNGRLPMRILGFKPGRGVSYHLVISVFLVLVLFVGTQSVFAEDTNSIATLRQMGKAFAQIAEKASPAVVGIRVKKTVITPYYTMPDWPFGEGFSPFDDDFFDRFFGRRSRPPRSQQRQQKSIETAQASGFIISADGYILTNNHLVGGAEKVMVKVTGRSTEMEAKVVGTDAATDVAVVKIDGDNLPYLRLADSDKLQVGEWVVAIGNPFGLSHTVTAGIVSAKGRRNLALEGISYQDFIQTDAAINFGNSGGPLIDLDGKVVGINTAIIGPGGNIGIGLAIPINMAKSVQQQLIDTGKVVRGYVGIYMTQLTPELAEGLGLSKDAKGVAVSQVIEGSPAEEVGIKHNDVIVEFEGQPVDNDNEFRNRVAMLKPGTKVNFVILRDGKRKTFTVKLAERPSEEKIAAAKSQTIEKLGLTVQNLTDDLAERFGYEGMAGVVVTQVESSSLAERAGIKAGMLIMEVNRESIANTKEFDKAVEKAGEDRSILLLITDGRYARYVILKLPKE